MLIIVLTSLQYLFVLRFFDGEKLKDIINYIQIVLTIVIMGGYQVFVRIFSLMDFQVRFEPKWWQYFIFPIWYAAPFQMIKKSEVNSAYITFIIMAAAVPFIAIGIYLKLMPLFELYLQKLNTNSQGAKRSRKNVPLLSKILCRTKEERIFFRFASDMMKNEREFKLKAYPSLGFAIAIPYIFIIQLAAGAGMSELSHGKFYYSIYFCGLMIPTAMWILRYSANYKGAWIYKTVPLKSYEPVFRGTIKAFLARLFMPLFLLQTVIFILIFGIRIIPDMIGIFITILIFNLLCFLLSEKALPFSEQIKTTQQMSGMITALVFAGLGAMALLQYKISQVPFGVYIYIALTLVIYIILWVIVFPRSLNQLKKLIIR